MFNLTISSNLPNFAQSLTTRLNKAIDQTMVDLSNSPRLPIFLGQASQRKIDRQDYKPLSPKYKIIRTKKYGNRPILRRTDAFYKRLVTGQAFGISLSSPRIINCKLTDLIGIYQQALGRSVIESDQQLDKDIAEEFKQLLNKNINT